MAVPRSVPGSAFRLRAFTANNCHGRSQFEEAPALFSKAPIHLMHAKGDPTHPWMDSFSHRGHPGFEQICGARRSFWHLQAEAGLDIQLWLRVAGNHEPDYEKQLEFMRKGFSHLLAPAVGCRKENLGDGAVPRTMSAL